MFTPGGGCAGGGCHCESCTIFADDFAADHVNDDPETTWSIESGTWTVSDGELSTSSSNALLIATTEYPGGGFHNHVIQVALKASTGNRSRIIFSYDAGVYNYVEVYWNHTASYVYIKTSAGATIATSAIQHYDDGSWYSFKVCVQATSATVNLNTSDYIIVGVVTSAATVCGLGTGSISAAILFESFVIGKHSDDMAGCPSCAVDCNMCSDGDGPYQFQLTIANVGGVCSECSHFNGTFICTQQSPGSCYWNGPQFSANVSGWNVDAQGYPAAGCTPKCVEPCGTPNWALSMTHTTDVCGLLKYRLSLALNYSSTSCTTRCGSSGCGYRSIWWNLESDTVLSCLTIDADLTFHREITFGGCTDNTPYGYNAHFCYGFKENAYGCDFDSLTAHVKAL
jgi:hypothetical protein